MGRTLAIQLATIISEREPDPDMVPSFVGKMARSAGMGIEQAVDLLKDDPNLNVCPTIEQLDSIADYLRADLRPLVEAARGDGCSFPEERQLSSNKILAGLQSILTKPQERDLSEYMLYASVRFQLSEMLAEEYWSYDFNGIYHDGSNMYGIVTKNGQSFKFDISLADNDEVTLSELMPATLTYSERSGEVRNSFSVSRSDGTCEHCGEVDCVQYVQVAGTAFLNSNGVIDSTHLFDSFIRHAEETGEYPQLDYAHKRSLMPLGRAHTLTRAGVAYIEEGCFYTDEISQSFARAVEEKPEEWGNSIYFLSNSPKLEQVRGDVSVPVFNKGVHTWTALLPANIASHVGTMPLVVQRSGNMPIFDKTEMEGFKKGIAHLPQDKQDALIERVSGLNALSDEEGAIWRSDQSKEDDNADGDNSEAVKSFSRSDLQAVADLVIAELNPKYEEPMNAVEQVRKELAEVRALVDSSPTSEMLEQQKKRLDKLDADLLVLQKPIEEARKDWLRSQPENNMLDLSTHRPKNSRPVEGKVAVGSGVIANEAMATPPQAGN